MPYMVIERFKTRPPFIGGSARKANDAGRFELRFQLIDHNPKPAWQIMETEDFVLLERWIAN